MLKWIASLLTLSVAALLLIHGMGEPGVRDVIRWSARSSLCLLCLALLADGIRGHFFGWRHWVGVLRTLAVSHGVHALAITALAWQTGGRNLLERGEIAMAGGGIAYAFIILGALRPHSRVVSLGLFWTWAVFLVSYGPRALRVPLPFGFAVGLLVVTMLVRLGSGLKVGVARNQVVAG